MINLWASDIGRWDAANYSLLKNVFELNLQLFQRSKKNKTLLFFVIRDHFYDVKRRTGTPIELLTPTIQKDLEKIWTDIIKPDDFKESKVQDFFDFDFTGLPHKLHAPDEFETKVNLLKTRFFISDQHDYLLDKKYKGEVPSDALPTYIARVWQTIKENKDLDLPSERQMVAVFRCSQIMEAILAKFNEQLKPLRKTLREENKEVQNFAAEATRLMKDAIDQYNTESMYYEPSVSEQKRQSLNDQMRRELHELFILQIKFITSNALHHFKEAFLRGLPSDGKAARNFAELANHLSQKTLTYFDQRATDSIPPGTEWDISLDRASLQEQIDDFISVQRKKQLELLLQEVQALLKKSIYNPLSQHMDRVSHTMWADLNKLYEDTQLKTSQTLRESLQGFNCNEQEIEERVNSLKESVFTQFRDMFREKVKGNLASKMFAKFNESFKYDSSGIPRKWTPEDNVASYFKTARDKGSQLIELFSVLRLKAEFKDVSVFDPSATIDPEYIILTPEECNQQMEIYKRDCDSAYNQAISEQEHAGGKAMMGPLMMGLIAVLGWNEAMMVLSWALFNPLFLILMIILGVVLYVGYAFDMLGVYGTVIKTVLSALLSEAKKFINQKLQAQGLNGPKPKTD
eukprot:TRINITY_DN3211_c0_g2_i6.p1 TRINITY_DN3211_c0_g2~~TRINITY_DN3211_c0_g2_i6.p1  ORF type:complete len:630 (+),score=149.63 TRINITY_DN3211_c0_g2_i6:486-2375(+)